MVIAGLGCVWVSWSATGRVFSDTFSFPPQDLKKYGATTVVRVCEVTYDKTPLEKDGITVMVGGRRDGCQGGLPTPLLKHPHPWGLLETSPSLGSAKRSMFRIDQIGIMLAQEQGLKPSSIPAVRRASPLLPDLT